MCEAMRRLMKDEIQQELEAAERRGWMEGRKELEAAERKGERKGKREGKQEMALSLFGMGMTIEKIAEAAEVSVQMVRKWLNADAKAIQP